ncbi:MAG: adenosylmethionine--8-amino-7-oxononanoate transaminase [Desulfovibrio sp.]|jgi:adenosylmethionine-8-amino-7-oxononanoate aminotransferase|nr:adenosylmethionine--8-amino-7-oxononanoate transaminase [Desulfovibrio sp.]
MAELRLICVCGTDTGVGKTVLCAALARAAHALGRGVLAVKPVQTGCYEAPGGELLAPDVEVYRQACPQAQSAALVTLRAPASPHLAARLEGRDISVAGLNLDLRACLDQSGADFVLLEGAGGLLTPLNEEESLLDFFACLDASLVLAVPNRLGAINHALLSIEAARGRGIEPCGFVLLNASAPASGREGDLERRIHGDNGAIISRRGALPCLGELPFVPGLLALDARRRERAWEKASGVLSAAAAALCAPCRADTAYAASILDFDREHLWHPYSSPALQPRAYEAVRARGASIILRDGRFLVDGMSSWWCAAHGYGRAELLQSLRGQAGRMPHVMFGGFTHAPAVDLGRRLLEIAPAGLEKIFYADSGSVAVEVALKMALQYQMALGRPEKKRILALRGAYHGDTLGAMSVCDPVNGMHSLFQGVLPEQIFAPRPECRFDALYTSQSAQELENIFKVRGREIAALILEPIVQGAGGMWFYHPDYLYRARELCLEHGCLLILDEIATGFGRTGRLFACEWARVSPDIMCLGKALTGGVITLSAVLASDAVAEGISRRGGILMHGPTFMANPLACAVAGASLDILGSGEWRDRVLGIEAGLRLGLEPCKGFGGVADVRVLGAIGVLEMERPVNVQRLVRYFVEEHGVWIRPFNRLIYLMPPYIISKEELARLTVAVCGAVREGWWI